MNLLKDTRTYLCGPMSNEPNNGVEWRNKLKPFLRSLGIRIFDPCDKPIDIGSENLEDRAYHRQLLADSKFDELAELIKTIRCVDLRMINVCDFLIVNIDTDINTCGTWEEIFLANNQKKPVIVHIKQGKNATPLWLFGTVPHKHIFSHWSSVENYLLEIDSGMEDDRWMLFDYART